MTPRAGAGERPGSWVAAVMAADTAAIYMGAGEAQAISEALMAAGKPGSTPAAVVENASLPESRVRYGFLEDLLELVPAAPAGPTLILLGEVYAEAARVLERKASQAA